LARPDRLRFEASRDGDGPSQADGTLPKFQTRSDLCTLFKEHLPTSMAGEEIGTVERAWLETEAFRAATP